MSEEKETGPIYGVELIDSLPLMGSNTLQAMPTAADLARVAEVNTRTVAGYELLLARYLALKDEHEKRMGCVVRNCAQIDDTKERDESGPMTGTVWSKVSYAMGLGSGSATEMCKLYGVDPDYDCAHPSEPEPEEAT